MVTEIDRYPEQELQIWHNIELELIIRIKYKYAKNQILIGNY